MDKWKNKKVFISGGAGVIGTALVHELLACGADLFVGDLKEKPADFPSSMRYRQGDLITLEAKELLLFKPEVYFHLAATFERSTESYDFFQENYHHNVALSHHLLNLFKDVSSLKSIVFASSYLVYNPSLYLFSTPKTSAVKLNEKSLIDPRNICGAAKYMHEKELEFLHHFRPEVQVASARIFRSYGKNSRDVISRWVRALLRKEDIAVFRPEGMFDYIYAEDVARGLLHLSEINFSGVVNLGSGRARSVVEVLNLLNQYLGEFKSCVETTDIPYEVSEADMTLFHRLTGCKCHFRSIEDGIREIISFERQHM